MSAPSAPELSSWLLPGLTRARLFGWGAVVVLALAAGRYSPVSPLALDRGAELYAAGDPAAAVSHYDLVGHYHPLASVRVEALRRAATLASIDLSNAHAARAYLERVLDEPTAPAEVQAAAWERLGRLLMEPFDAPEDAASAFQLAWQLDTLSADAGRRLIAAARARTETDDVQAAVNAWDRVFERVPGAQGLARVSQGALLLAHEDHLGALEAYEEALAIADDPHLEQVARLGAATCRERMGDVDAALADIDAADLPPDVAAERQRRLEERSGAL